MLGAALAAVAAAVATREYWMAGHWEELAVEGVVASIVAAVAVGSTKLPLIFVPWSVKHMAVKVDEVAEEEGGEAVEEEAEGAGQELMQDCDEGEEEDLGAA